MLDEMHQGLEKLAEEPYDKIKEYKLKTRELKEVDFGEINAVKFIILSLIKLILGVR